MMSEAAAGLPRPAGGEHGSMRAARASDGLTSDAVVDRIKELIVARGLRPGDRLPTENQLAADFGVSRITVREATKALRFLGILRSAPKRGLTVGNLDIEQLRRCLDFHLHITAYPREQLLRARMIIELGVLPYVARRMARDPAIEKSLLAHTELPRITTDPAVYIKADLAFHRELIAASETAPLEFFDHLLRLFFERFRAEAIGPDRQAMVVGVRTHRRIVSSLRDGQVGIAQDLVRESFEIIESRMEDPTP
jgi:DNA-binding FadR family transcriptional regulator